MDQKKLASILYTQLKLVRGLECKTNIKLVSQLVAKNLDPYSFTLGWQDILESPPPEKTRVLLGPPESPVVGEVTFTEDETGEKDFFCKVVHYNGNALVTDYHCTCWHPLPPLPEKEDQEG